MQVVDLDGNWSNWSVMGGISKGSIAHKSALHITARDLIKKIYPTMQLLEEVTIYTHKNEVSYLDFYIPLIRKCIEVHGEQHYKYISFYHSSPLGFLKAQKKDREKKEWCNINNIILIELPFNKQNEWKDLIIND
jgi:very-short-patch-repair endonuclease